MGFLAKTRTILVMIKFEHSVFALPFAYLGMLLAEGGIPDGATVVWVTLAMIGARSFAMALNRLLDVNTDRRNPRTASRALPRGLISISEVIVFLAASLAVFFLAVSMLPLLVSSALAGGAGAHGAVFPDKARYLAVSFRAGAVPGTGACWSLGCDSEYAAAGRNLASGSGRHALDRRV